MLFAGRAASFVSHLPLHRPACSLLCVLSTLAASVSHGAGAVSRFQALARTVPSRLRCPSSPCPLGELLFGSQLTRCFCGVVIPSSFPAWCPYCVCPQYLVFSSGRLVTVPCWWLTPCRTDFPESAGITAGRETQEYNSIPGAASGIPQPEPCRAAASLCLPPDIFYHIILSHRALTSLVSVPDCPQRATPAPTYTRAGAHQLVQNDNVPIIPLLPLLTKVPKKKGLSFQP